jgi:hypothetical protein
MPDLRTLSTGTKILVAAGVLLFLDTFLAWQEVSVEVGGVEIASASRNAWHGFWGVVMGVALVALLIWVAIQIFKVEVPNLTIPERTVTAALAGLVFVLALLKNLVDDYSAWPSYVGIVLAAGVAVGGWMRLQEADEAAAPAAAEAAPPPPPPPPAAPPTTGGS